MRESCSYGSVRERGGNEPLYSDSHLAQKDLRIDGYKVDITLDESVFPQDSSTSVFQKTY